MKSYTLLHYFPSPINVLSLRSSSSPPTLHSTTTPHRTHASLFHSTAPPNSSAILTIFYIFYHPSLQTPRILLFSRFWFRTVQNVDASFLSPVSMLSLLCLLSPRPPAWFSAQSVLVVWFSVSSFPSPFHSMTSPIICVLSHIPPSFMFPYLPHPTSIPNWNTSWWLLSLKSPRPPSTTCQCLYYRHDSSSCGYFVIQPVRSWIAPLLSFSLTMYLFPFVNIG